LIYPYTPKDILEVLPQEYQINSIYHQIVPYFDDLDFLVSNIEYANKNCDKNYPAYLKTGSSGRLCKSKPGK